MKRFHLKKQRSLVSNRKRIPLYATAAVILALAIAFGAALINRNSVNRALIASRENLVLSVRASITAIARAHERMSRPGADVAGDLLPTMQLNLHTAEALNDVLVDSYGEQYAVLNDDLFRKLNDDLITLSDTLDKGQIITDVQTAIGQTLADVETALIARFGADDGLMPVTAST